MIKKKKTLESNKDLRWESQIKKSHATYQPDTAPESFQK